MIEPPGDLKPGDRVVLPVRAANENSVIIGAGMGALGLGTGWLRENATLLPEPAVDVDRLRRVAKEMRYLAERDDDADWFRDALRGYAASIEACLPPTEPPYTDPKFHLGMLVQAENGTGPLWLYDSDDDEDTHPFHRVKGPWYTRSELPDRLRVVYIDHDGQVRPVKEAGE